MALNSDRATLTDAADWNSEQGDIGLLSIIANAGTILNDSSSDPSELSLPGTPYLEQAQTHSYTRRDYSVIPQQRPDLENNSAESLMRGDISIAGDGPFVLTNEQIIQPHKWQWTQQRRRAICYSYEAPTLLPESRVSTSAVEFGLRTNARRRAGSPRRQTIEAKEEAPSNHQANEVSTTLQEAHQGSEISSTPPAEEFLSGDSVTLFRASGFLCHITSTSCIVSMTALFGGTASVTLLAAFSLGMKETDTQYKPPSVLGRLADSKFLYCISARLLLILGAYMALVALLQNTHRVKAKMWKWIGV